MARKSSGRSGESGTDTDTERGLFTRIVEDVIAFAICCFLVKLGVGYILAVKVPLTVIAVIIAIVVISYRAYRWRRHDDF